MLVFACTEWLECVTTKWFIFLNFISYFRCCIIVKFEPAVMLVQELSASASTPTKEVRLG